MDNEQLEGLIEETNSIVDDIDSWEYEIGVLLDQIKIAMDKNLLDRELNLLLDQSSRIRDRVQTVSEALLEVKND